MQITENLVIVRELAWTKAHQELDLQLIDEILSEDYLQIEPDGSSIRKSELLEAYSSGKRYWEIAESTEHLVQIWGDLGILFGRWRGKGVNNTELFDYTARFIAIYRWENGSLKLIHDRSLPD